MKKKPKWPKKLASVLCSPWFFLAACAVGTLLGLGPLDAIGARSMERGERPDPRMVVIVSVPDPASPGMYRVEPVMLAALQSFREANPGASLVPPQSSGKIEKPLTGIVAEYSAEPAGDGALTVETRFRQDFVSVKARYVATRTEVKPVSTKTGSAFQPYLIGLGIAALLGMIGRILKYSMQYEEARGR